MELRHLPDDYAEIYRVGELLFSELSRGRPQNQRTNSRLDISDGDTLISIRGMSPGRSSIELASETEKAPVKRLGADELGDN
jgi:hypothetical protein